MITTLAKRIREAGESGVPCSVISKEIPKGDLLTAYAIQNINIVHWARQGRRIIGRKIGIIERTAQSALGLNEPIYGTLFSDTMVDNDDVIEQKRVMAPKIEAEIALVIGKALTTTPTTPVDVMRACAFVMPALEITGSRFAGGKVEVVDDIADNCGSGLFVLGTPANIASAFFGRIEVALVRYNRRSVVISATSSLSRALSAAAWLATKMISQGTPMLEGDVVMSGAIGGDVEVSPGCRVEALFDSFQPIRVAFSD